jgi:uncharacterized membrane protein (UPF0127 family)
MSLLEVRNTDRGTTLGTRIGMADRWWRRLRGLIGRPPPTRGSGLLITPCQAVHTLGMRHPLDVLFLDRAGRVVAVYEALAPVSRTRWHREARFALELPAGTIRDTGTANGDHLTWPAGPGTLQCGL